LKQLTKSAGCRGPNRRRPGPPPRTKITKRFQCFVPLLGGIPFACRFTRARASPADWLSSRTIAALNPQISTTNHFSGRPRASVAVCAPHLPCRRVEKVQVSTPCRGSSGGFPAEVPSAPRRHASFVDAGLGRGPTIRTKGRRHASVRRGIHRDVLSRVDNRLHLTRSGSGSDCSAGHRGSADGDDLRGRPHFGRPLQPGSHARSIPAGAVSCLGRAAILGRPTARCRGCGLDSWLRPSGRASGSIPCPRVFGAFLAGFLFTFALMYVVLNVTTADATDGNSYFGLAIGFTVLAGAFAVGQVSGAALNPAVAIGASLRGLLPWSNLWLYIVAELLGGAAAAFVFKALNPTSRPGTAKDRAAARRPRAPRVIGRGCCSCPRSLMTSHATFRPEAGRRQPGATAIPSASPRKAGSGGRRRQATTSAAGSRPTSGATSG
jgi:hypothetical protein